MGVLEQCSIKTAMTRLHYDFKKKIVYMHENKFLAKPNMVSTLQIKFRQLTLNQMKLNVGASGCLINQTITHACKG